MRRNVATLLTIIALLMVVNPSQTAVVAAPVPSTINLRADALQLTADERAAILQGLQSTVESFRSRPAWRCVLTPVESAGQSTPAASTRVHIDALMSPAAGGSQDVAITIEVQIGGKTGGSRQGTVPAGLGGGYDRGPGLRDEAMRNLSDILNGLSPCTPTIKVRGRTSIAGEVNFETSFEGETKLSLTEDGSFSGTMQATFARTPISFPGVGSCTVDAGNQETIDYAGKFEDSDGALTFTRMEARAAGGTVSITCALDGQSFSTSVPATGAFGADPTALLAVRLPLEDGARAVIPFGAPEVGLSSEVTVELALGLPDLAAQPRPPVTPTPTRPPEQRPAPIQLSQSLEPATPNTVPIAGQRFAWRHVTRVNNPTRAEGQPLSAGDSPPVSAFRRLGLLAQGESVSVSFQTDNGDDVQFTGTTASQGRVTTRGTSLNWEGQVEPGQSVEIIATFNQTPPQALSVSSPVRGQSLVVTDARGTSLVVQPPPRPLPPPAQRLVQPPPPPVDPTTGPRLFPATGFAVANDAIWVYYHRRGGPRTFGSPISRLMRIGGAEVQLFERGMLQVGEGGAVTALNLLEPPFLTFQNLGDVLLPSVAEDLVANAPSPDQPDFGERAQEFVRVNSPQEFEGLNPQFYSAFLGTVRFSDAFFDGRGDPNLLPGFNLEIWGLPRSQPSFFTTAPEQTDATRALLLYQRGVMVHDSGAGITAPLPLGRYIRALLMGDDSLPALVEAAQESPLWAQYDPEAVGWVARPDELPDSNLVLAFTPDE